MTSKERARELVTLLNKATGSPLEPYADTRDAKGGLIPLAGCFMIDGANYRYRIERMSEGGGHSTPFGHERYTIGKLVTLLHRVLDGVQLGKDTERKTHARLSND